MVKNEQENTQNNVIEGDIRKEMTVDTDQKYQEIFEAAVNMIVQLKQSDKLNKGHGKMYIPYLQEVSHVSSYPLLESMSFDTDISDKFSKMRAATLLKYIFRLHQRTKNMPKYVHTDSDYCHLVAIPASDTHE